VEKNDGADQEKMLVLLLEYRGMHLVWEGTTPLVAENVKGEMVCAAVGRGRGMITRNDAEHTREGSLPGVFWD